LSFAITQENRSKEVVMRNRFFFKAVVYILSFSFLFLTTGFSTLIADAANMDLPIGEMVSNGEVKVEVKQNVWKSVEPSTSSLFKGTKVRTDKGKAALSLANQGQIDIDQNSLLTLEQSDRVTLSQGQIKFQIPVSGDLEVKVGDLRITKFKTLLVAKDLTLVSPQKEETIGALSIHANGSIMVKSLQGPLSILNQDRVMLAAISSKESVTIPATSVKGASKTMVAQAGDPAPQAGAGAEGAEFLGLGTWTWIGIAGGVAVIGGIAAAAGGGGGGGGGGAVPICP
jgi:hypothetical protein